MNDTYVDFLANEDANFLCLSSNALGKYNKNMVDPANKLVRIGYHEELKELNKLKVTNSYDKFIEGLEKFEQLKKDDSLDKALLA